MTRSSSYIAAARSSAARRLLPCLVALATSATVLTACSGDASSDTGADGLTTVTFALNYIPDPSLNGLAYAMEEGLFEEQGIDVELVPYGSTPAESLVASGQADLGLATDIRTALIAMASGADLTSYFATYQHVPYALTVLDDSPYQRPADLAGKTYGGFGSPMELAVVNDMIAADGGDEEAENVTLSTGTYDALGAGRVDTVLSFPGDAFALEQAGQKVRTWSTLDYDLPDVYGGLLIASGAYAEEHPEVVEGFTRALQEGYQAALEDSAAADEAALATFPDELDPAVLDYVSTIQTDELYPSPSGVVGAQDAAVWQENADWLIGHGLLVDAAGEPLDSFDTSTVFTDEYLQP